MENEEAISTSNQDQDPNLHKKHLSMLERLSNRHQTRIDNSLARQSESDSSTSSSSTSSTSSFLSRFSDSKRSIESQLAQSRLTHPTDLTQLRSHLDSISASISDLEKLVAECSYFLPSYEVRSSLKTISDLRQSLENLNSELIPKKKFAFKNKSSKKDLPITPENTDSFSIPHEKSSFVVRDSPGFRNKSGVTLVKNFKGSEVGEFTVSDLDSCEVRLIGSVRSLFVHRLRNCKVYAGPIIGSILIEQAEGCVFVVASHQIRIHNAKGSDFYLRVRSRPIIEDCNGVRFAPFCLSYEGIEEDLRDASLDEETGNWGNVDDFKWLRAVQSPNWSVLPENERAGMVNISNSGAGIEGN
ncbi:tubulin-folding cofactor C [Fagus crenata]